MYGLLLEGLKQYLVREYGVEVWQTAVQQLSGEVTGIQIKRVYPESLLPSIVRLVAKSTGHPEDEIYFAYGNFHKKFLSLMGYERIIRAIANGFPQFINTLDDVHQNMQINYPRMRGPTFVISAMTNTTMEVTYSSKRNCYAQMVRGQLTAIATSLFGLDVDVELIGYEKVLILNRYTYRITNKNGEWPPSYMTSTEVKMDTIAASHTFGESLLSFFQFHLLFTNDLKIVSLGKGYEEIKEVALGELLPDVFMLNRPKIGATFAEIKRNCHVTFELVLISDVGMNMDTENERTVSKRTVTFRGQMLYVEECEMILFLGTPVIRDIKQLCQCGLYLSDFSLFDRRRDLILGAEIAKFFNEQTSVSAHLERNMVRIGKLQKLADDLLFNCIPETFAKQLRKGTMAMDTVQAFDAVSICFTKVVDFDKKCMMMPVEELIYMLNKMYTIFDCLTESRNVYKVETVGGSYMFVSGAPQRTRLHAAHIAELALEMLSVTQNGFFWDTHGSGDIESDIKLEQVQLLFGCHTGSVVTGVLGHNAPRYCLFGDAVNTANRMMSTGLGFMLDEVLSLQVKKLATHSTTKIFDSTQPISPIVEFIRQPNKIHASNSFAEALKPYPFVVESRGKTIVKGKGEMETFFISGRNTEVKPMESGCEEEQRFTNILKHDLDTSNDVTSESVAKMKGPEHGSHFSTQALTVSHPKKVPAYDHTENSQTATPTGVQTIIMNSECKAIGRFQKRDTSYPFDGKQHEEDSANKSLNWSLSSAVHLGVEKESSFIPISHSLNKSVVKFLQHRQSKTVGDVFHTPSFQFEETSLETTTHRSEKALLHSGKNPVIVNASDHHHTKLHCVPLNSLRDSAGNTSKAALGKETNRELFQRMVTENQFGPFPMIPLRSSKSALLHEVVGGEESGKNYTMLSIQTHAARVSLYRKHIDTQLANIRDQPADSHGVEPTRSQGPGLSWCVISRSGADAHDARHTDQTMYSCGSLAPTGFKASERPAGLNQRPTEPWEHADGALRLIGQIAECSPQIFTDDLVDKMLKACEYKHYTHYPYLLDTACNVVIQLYKGLEKPRFKRHLDNLLILLTNAFESQLPLAILACKETLEFLSAHVGPNVIRGRIENHLDARVPRALLGLLPSAA
ncbi:soluble guanylate cyclase 88E [Clonorchis sinensis]|uniref:guanylate cyclase n=1 Tax=Clonorchis sinensis TaxID=79923 RepID=G7YDL4_CLOSI|nr:soluble guanylate cyclase 88E [Clonorchis sinensis]